MIEKGLLIIAVLFVFYNKKINTTKYDGLGCYDNSNGGVEKWREQIRLCEYFLRSWNC